MWAGAWLTVLAEVAVVEIAAATARHARRLLSAGVRPLVALVPPLRSDAADANRAVRELNTALRSAFPAEWIVDFWTGFGDAELVDRVHLRDEAQARRARIAAEALARFPPESAP